MTFTPTVKLDHETQIEVNGAHTTWGQWLAQKEEKEARDWAEETLNRLMEKNETVNWKEVFYEMYKEIRRQVKNRHSY